jgi:hypothetical protein
MRAKYQDNLENMQWFKSFYEKNCGTQPYDPIPRRAKGKGADNMPAFALDPARRGPVSSDMEQHDAPVAAAPVRSAAKTTTAASAKPSTTGTGAGTGAASTAASRSTGTAPVATRKAGGASSAGPSTASAAVRSPAHGHGHGHSGGQLEAAAAARISSLTNEIGELRVSVRANDARIKCALPRYESLTLLSFMPLLPLLPCRSRALRRSATSTSASCATSKSCCRPTPGRTDPPSIRSSRYSTPPTRTSSRSMRRETRLEGMERIKPWNALTVIR